MSRRDWLIVGVVVAFLAFLALYSGRERSRAAATAMTEGVAQESVSPEAKVETAETEEESAPEPAATAPPTTKGGQPAEAPAAGAVGDGICRGDKIATINEVDFAGPQRIEVSTGDKIHLDYYPMPGIRAVSVIVHSHEFAILAGFGSMWQFALRDCASYDFLEDARVYAEGRQGRGHAGIVWASLTDWLAGNPPAINLFGLDPSQFRPVFWAGQVRPMSGSPSSSAILGQAQSPAPVTGTSGAKACPDGEREDHPPTVGETWSPAGEWRTVNFWTNEPGHDQSERKLLLSPDDDVALLGGGSSWSWPADCEDAARENFASNSLPEVTLDELRGEDIVR